MKSVLVGDALVKKFGYKNVSQIPKIVKVVINAVSKECVLNAKIAETIQNDISVISGQKACLVRAKKSIASFKLKEGQALGAMVTLRGSRMNDFLKKFVHFTLPRVKDFRGISAKSFDGKGNYTIGLKEQIIFPEINFDKIDKIRGMSITVVTSAKSAEEARELLALNGFPFKK